MSINRQQRRQLGRRGDAPGWVVPDDETGTGPEPGDGEADAARATGASGARGSGADGGNLLTAKQAPAPSRHRVGPRQFLHEVNVEMRKVAWPTRAETVNYSTVVLVTLVLLTAMIFGLDIAFQHAANFLFNP